jgi:hypothetical protein
MSLWWLSFADENRCHGVAIVEGSDLHDAIDESIVIGANPGPDSGTGVVGFILPPFPPVPAEYQNRLLAAGEAMALNEILRRRSAN